MLIIGQSDNWIHRENNITGTLVGYYDDGVFRSLRGKEDNEMRKWVEFKKWKWKFILFLDKFCNA